MAEAWPLSACEVLEEELVTLHGTASKASWVMGTNAFSLHGMRGNRLVRAHLGASTDPRESMLRDRDVIRNRKG